VFCVGVCGLCPKVSLAVIFLAQEGGEARGTALGWSSRLLVPAFAAVPIVTDP
jgi:hypothetical protein